MHGGAHKYRRTLDAALDVANDRGAFHAKYSTSLLCADIAGVRDRGALRDIAREAGNFTGFEFSCAKLPTTVVAFDLRTLQYSTGGLGTTVRRHLRPTLKCQAAPAAETTRYPSAVQNSSVCTCRIFKEGSIDVSNWESFVHCRAYGSHENGVLIKARINIEIK